MMRNINVPCETFAPVNRGYDDRAFQFCWKTKKSVLRGVIKLARQLLLLGLEKRLEIINEHTHQLRRGGELLTHVSLLMLHLGLSEQYEFTRFDKVYAWTGSTSSSDEVCSTSILIL
jgi:hypothetical protein